MNSVYELILRAPDGRERRQLAFVPNDRDGIADYDWVHAQTGKRAVILDGLPRLPDQLPDTLPDIVKGLFEGGNFPNAKINILTDDNAVVSYHE